MLRSKLGLALVALAVLALGVPTLSLAGRNTVELEAKLKGKNEVPGPGSRKGKGEIDVDVKPTKEKLCFDFEVKKLDPMVAGHIHKGDSETAGPVKVTLFEDRGGARWHRRLRGLRQEGQGEAPGQDRGGPGEVLRQPAHGRLPRRGDSRTARALRAGGLRRLGGVRGLRRLRGLGRLDVLKARAPVSRPRWDRRGRRRGSAGTARAPEPGG